jgi:branched-chain amino acid transport system permease protein
MSDIVVTLLLGIMQGGLYALVGLGLTITFGVTHILNFAHGEFVTVGSFSLILLVRFMPTPLAILVALAIAAVISALVYVLGFALTIGNHLQGLALSMGLLLFVENIALDVFSARPRTGPRIDGTLAVFGDERIAWSRLVVIATTILVVAVAALAMKYTWVGLALRATGSDSFAAATLGMSARKVGLYAFIAAGVLAGIAGMSIASVAPVTPSTGVDYLLIGFVVSIIGGLGSAEGVLVASIGLGLIEALTTRYVDPTMTAVYVYGAMVVVLLVLPQGIFNRKVVRAG